ncbi:3-keto-5-aminohexanoate cleavage protein [Brevibacillus reuszeri]|uniref:3-keto-5-aminohexanoate cleavage protein n=2 Tax=Brevibacillus reuszeri TaxID=54915 RepID=A0ABQ0TXQ3_9BACL|nr:3-keto-5-aminohexanoate cleavage protein [Brevibacillus reuszeri]MED1859307.1 3-keto-5-aminohexanoate cleavage protein [Brevibacillus reuszeri]GED72625.1 3-keto-5-aminohexanoate cleavage protein [Brevibacillus reuszeri]
MDNDYIWNFANSYDWMERIGKLPPLVVTCAVNGGIQGKEVNANLPETPAEIAQSAYEAYNAGASIVHIHARDRNCIWKNAENPEEVLEVNGAVRSKCKEIIINNSTGLGFQSTMEGRLNVLEANPEIATLNMGPFMERVKFIERRSPLQHARDSLEIDGVIPFTYGVIESFASRMAEKSIKPELEVYQPGHYWTVKTMITKGLVKPPYFVQFVMGTQTGIYPTPQNLLNLISELPHDTVFSTIGIGKYQWALTTLSIMMGGHVRVGMEDNIYVKRGQKLKSNAEAVEKIVRIAKEFNREIATPAQAREMLGISAIPKTY